MMVRLEVHSIDFSQIVDYNFNSMMVRLEVLMLQLLMEGHSEFQFHDGAIGSCYDVYYKVVEGEFQFHDGAIGRPRRHQPSADIQISIP